MMSNAPTLAEVQGILQTLSRAAENCDAATYRHALDRALVYDVTDEQIIDAYRWGCERRRTGPSPDFNAWCQPHRH